MHARIDVNQQPVGSLPAIVFEECELKAAARLAKTKGAGKAKAKSATRRREVKVGGKRVKTIDVHCHAVIPEALALLGRGAFLPVHWGTFALALHDWDQPAEALLTLGPKKGADLLMPRLGEPVEPAHPQELTPWWRAVDLGESRQYPSEKPLMTLPKAMPWPFD